LVNLRLSRSLRQVLPERGIATDERTRRAKSGDYHWFSPILEHELREACADICVFPESAAELAAALGVAHDEAVPVTLRGGGTGNFGQCVPLEGGLVISTERLTRVLAVEDGHAWVEPGATFAIIDRAASAADLELPIFPTTYRTASVGGFVAGGSAGVGSATHGGIPDGNIRALDIAALTARPSTVRVEGPEVWPHLHAYGTTGVIAAVDVTLVPRRSWEQAVVTFDSLWPCHAFCLDLLRDPGVEKRLVTTLDAGVVAHYQRSAVPFRPGCAAALLIYESASRNAVAAHTSRHGGEVDFTLPGDAKTKLFEFTFNHSTLWAKKADTRLTYMQASLDTDRSEEQLRAIAAAYPELAVHLEYLRWAGQPLIEMLPIFPYRDRAQLAEMITHFEALGLAVANPHTYVLEEGSSVDDLPGLLAAKKQYDPASLLNPGKLAVASRDGARPLFGSTASMSLGHVHVNPERGSTCSSSSS
jgi:FAD/FMN-containing dehydrogenase